MNLEDVEKELKRYPLLNDSPIKFESLAQFIGFLVGQEMAKDITNEEIEKLLEELKK